MILKITLLVLIISNILLWISHTKMKFVIGGLIKVNRETLEHIIETIEGDDKK